MNITDPHTVKVMVLGVLAMRPNTKMTAPVLGNRDPLRSIDMRLIRDAAEQLAREGLLELGVGYGGSNSYLFRRTI